MQLTTFVGELHTRTSIPGVQIRWVLDVERLGVWGLTCGAWLNQTHLDNAQSEVEDEPEDNMRCRSWRHRHNIMDG